MNWEMATRGVRSILAAPRLGAAMCNPYQIQTIVRMARHYLPKNMMDEKL
jgi:hypothetical protein